MPETPAAPAPSAPAAAPSAPAPAAPAPAAPAAAVPAVPAAPAPYDPKTAAAPPKSSDYSQDSEGLVEFAKANSAWSMEHPEEAERIRAEKIAAEDGIEPQAAPDATAAAVKAAEGEPEAPKPPAEAAPVAAATPAAIEEWMGKSPELKAAFEKSPEMKSAVMEMARGFEAAKEVMGIVSTKEEAEFAVEHANRLVSLQTNWILSAEDPEMVGPAWEQTVEMFKERDANGAEVKGPDGKPKLGSDFKPFVRKAASSAMEDFAGNAQAQITALEAKLAGNYASDELREADADALENTKYEKAAFDFVLAKLSGTDDGTKLPSLPPNATPEQIAFQKQLEAERKDLDAKAGKSTAESRKQTTKQLNSEVQKTYEEGVNRYIDTQVAAMKERGEYLPDFVLNDKWTNPSTGKATNLSAFGVKIYLALNDKINKNPLHAAKLMSLEALGVAGKDARIAEITRLQNLYLPKIFNAEVQRIQDGIRASTKKPPAAPPGTGPRVEPQSQGTVVPQTLDASQVRAWAEAEAKKDTSYAGMTSADREALTISLAMKKRFGT